MYTMREEGIQKHPNSYNIVMPLYNSFEHDYKVVHFKGYFVKFHFLVDRLFSYFTVMGPWHNVITYNK